ncbi:hypothetical protein KC19_6G095600 [Ceratodon purpureus]|uniref:Threonine/serine exporter-like N-terminal domain-containing protein n=1 Tax=Ceratodon purpureus TaxID=3225 RepID=A0A8T0HFV4_CERPU|nr:hypothetical protein KC19_6G095600 [Ceratodon purpureus]
MADLTQSLYDVEDQLKLRGFQARMVKVPNDASEADSDAVARLQGEEPVSEWSQGLRRRFLRRLTVALVSYGSSAPRTEYLIKSASKRLKVKTKIAVLNSLVILMFVDTADATKEELHLVKLNGSVDVNKLQQIDELANSVGLRDTPVMMGQWKLQATVKSPSCFEEWYWQLLAFVISAGTGALLFFQGNYWDAVFSMFLGLVVGIIFLLVPFFPVFGIVAEFSSALVVSFLARVFTHYFVHLDVCFFAMAISGLVWLLPGQNLTIGVSEVVEGAVVTGSARIVKALVSSLQLGFGLMIGEKVAWWLPKLEPTPCADPNISPWFLIIWVLGFVFSMNILLRARWGQWFGMTLVAGIGYVAYELTEKGFGAETAAVLSSFAIGLSATIFSYAIRDIPLSMVMAGIQVLLPGGIGVQGVDILMKEDVMSGISFMMNMVIVCLSITIGLLLSKVLLHDGVFGATKMLKRQHRSRHLYEDYDTKHQDEGDHGTVADNQHEEDEHMAI